MSIINAGCIGEGPCWEDLHPDEAAEIAWRIRAEENTIPIVDLDEIKPVHFNKTQVYDELNTSGYSQHLRKEKRNEQKQK